MLLLNIYVLPHATPNLYAFFVEHKWSGIRRNGRIPDGLLINWAAVAAT